MTTTLLILCGAGIGSLVTVILVLLVIRGGKSSQQEMMLETKKRHCETLCELKRRNELLIEANEIAKEQFAYFRSLHTQPVTISGTKVFSGEVKPSDLTPTETK